MSTTILVKQPPEAPESESEAEAKASTIIRWTPEGREDNQVSRRRCTDCMNCKVRKPWVKSVEWEVTVDTLVLAKNPVVFCKRGYWQRTEVLNRLTKQSALNRLATVCGEYDSDDDGDDE